MKAATVDHYGVHRAPNGLLYLLQDDEQNSRGLNVKSNLRVKTYRRLPITHNIRLADGTLSDRDDAVVRSLERSKAGKLFLPTPGNAGKIVFVNEQDVEFSKILAATMLSSPTPKPLLDAAWRVTGAELVGQSRRTNVQPYAVTAVTPRWMKENGSQIVDLYRMGTRPLVLFGTEDVVLPPEIERVSGTALRKLNRTEKDLPLIGSIYLRNWMRNQ